MKAGSVPEDSVKMFVDTVTPVYERYKNIGVRIEDDVLVTEDGVKVLSDKAPKSIDEIEKVMKGRSELFK